MRKLIITGGSGFIGTNLISFLKNNYEILNIDIKPPVDQSQNSFWVNCNILDKAKLCTKVYEFKPDLVIHLAARADVYGKSLADYRTNTEGTKNVLDAINNTSSIERVIITSTQFVNQYNGLPKNDEDFAPHTVYGESKVITEKLTRKSNLNCCWTIIRPTNIWGPWHNRYPYEFWKIIAENKYFHPANQNVIRSYGYVGNVCSQIYGLLKTNEDTVNRQVFYVGDEPINILDWVNEFSVQLTGKNVKQVDKHLIKSIAFIGDILKYFSIKFPLTSSRFKSMTTSNQAPMEKTFKILGTPPFTLKEGVQETIKWLRKYHPNLVRL